MTTTKLFVGNITRGADNAELKALFEQFGTVVECDILSDYGFVHFADAAEADSALSVMHGYEFHGQKLKVEKSTSYVRRRPGDGNLSAENCYVCGKTGHWAKNCPQVPESERAKQSKRAEKNRRGRDDGGPPGFRRPDPRDDYDDYYDMPPRRRRPPPPDYYDDYDDYDLYYRRRLPPPRYYDDLYDYDYPPPPRRLPPPGYYRRSPPRRPLPYYPEARSAYPEARGVYPEDRGAYPEDRGAYPEDRGAYPEARGAYPPARPNLGASARPGFGAADDHNTAATAEGYFDFTDDNVEKVRPAADIDPLAGTSEEYAAAGAGLSYPATVGGGPTRPAMDHYRRARPY